jgi:exosortase
MTLKSGMIASGRIIGWKGRLVLFMVALVVLGATLYWETLSTLFVGVLKRHDSSHGLFVPFISAYLVWLRFEKIKEASPRFDLLKGGLVVAVAFLGLYVARGSGDSFLSAVSFFLLVAGLVLGLFGAEVFKTVRFPLLFLVTMIPLPPEWYRQVARTLRQASTWGSLNLFKICGFPLYCEGYHVYLEKAHLFVDPTCGGVRYLLSYLAFGLAYAFRYRETLSSRLLVLVFALAVSLAASVLRLFVIFLAVDWIGPFMAEPRPHLFLSWFVFAAVLVGVITLDRLLSKKWKREVSRRAG